MMPAADHVPRTKRDPAGGKSSGVRGLISMFDLDHGVIGRYEFHVDDAGVIHWDRLTLARGECDASTSDPLRRLGLGVLAQQRSEWLRHPLVQLHLGGDVKLARRRPGRRGSDPLQFAVWAARDVQALRIDQRRPASVILREAARRGEHITLKDVNNAVARARELRLLTRSARGRAGGELTQAAKQLLENGGFAHLLESNHEDGVPTASSRKNSATSWARADQWPR
jgi:hypothetical protein